MNMRCVNCGIALRGMQRRKVSSLSEHHKAILSRWLTLAPTELHLDEFICHPCFLLFYSKAGEHDRLLGHSMVCVGCGKSVRTIRHQEIRIGSPLLTILLLENPNYVPSRNNYVCHACWVRATRHALDDSSQDIENNAEAPDIPVAQPPNTDTAVEPPEPPPVPVQEKKVRKKSGADLDRFKRRLIRAVARLLIQEKKTEEELWAQLKIETGSNCKLLWTRMRALTEKKLSHLLAVNDRTLAIPKPARMSLTDWLLFDLVLVHQKIDVIGQDRPQGSEDPQALVDLFGLVNKFKIEGLSGDNLAEAWSNATLYYNSKGHQCSPMLLQRRWYQLKELTRAKFYDFWYAYRGTVKRLALAEPHTPSPLQAAIAKQYKHLVTTPFLEWEELIKWRLVTLPEEFERKLLERTPRTNVRKPTEEGPDLELIEPNIDTIDLRNEPDDDNENEEMDQVRDSPIPTVKIKEEPLDTEMDIGEIEVEVPKKSIYDSVLESTDIENEKLESMDAELIDDEPGYDEHADDELYTEEKEIEETIATTLRDQENSVLPQITNVFGNVSAANVLSNLEVEQSDVKDFNTDEKVTVEDASVSKVLESSSKDNIEVKPQGYDDSFTLDDKNNVKETVIGNINDCNKVDIETKVPDDVKDSTELVSTTENLPKDASDTKTEDNIEDVVIIDNTPAPVVIPDSDDEEKLENSDDFIDDIFLPAHHEPIDVKTDPVPPNDDKNINKITLIREDNDDKKPDIPGFSFGQLPNDISFADEGIVYVDEDSNKEKRVKPDADDSPKIDPKLLMLPIVYTTRLDHMALTQFQHINDKTLIDNIAAKSKPIKLETHTRNSIDEENIPKTSIPIKQEPLTDMPLDEKTIVTQNDPVEQKPDTDIPPDDSDSDDEEIPDSNRVKPSSYLLQKPRSRTYNPIQLCKNPDFNTRLKWLTVGFFTIPRNRGLIKTCKPLTVDVSKAFESKLISGRLYLKPSDVNIKIEDEVKEDVESIQSVTVVPSAMPAQSLIDNSKIPYIPAPLPSQFQKLTPDIASTNERNRVISLPDISEIRRINQRLLTAEVTPIQVQNNQPQVPVSLVTSPNTQSCVTKTTVALPETGRDLLKEADDVRGPPECVDITKDRPDKVNKNLLVESDSHMQKRPQGRPFKMHNGKRLYPVKSTTVAWKPRAVKEKIPWLTRMNDPTLNTKMVEETLLTLDTLNKMLFLLIDKEEQPAVSNAKTCKNKKKSDKSQLQDEQSKSGKNSTADKNSANNSSETAKKYCKVNVRPGISRAQSSSTVEKTPEPDKKQYCCWSRQRMLELLFSQTQKTAHNCSTNFCICCCQKVLKDYIMRAMVMKESYPSKSGERELTYISSSFHIFNERAKKPRLVAVPVKVTVHFPPTSSQNVVVEVLKDNAEKNDYTIDASETSGFVPAMETGLSELATTVVTTVVTAAATTVVTAAATTEVTAAATTEVTAAATTVVTAAATTVVTAAATTVVTAAATTVTTIAATPVTRILVNPVPAPEVTPITAEAPPVSLVEETPIPTVRGIETPVSVSSGDGRSNLKSNPSKRSRLPSADKQHKIIPLICEPNPPIQILPLDNSPSISKKKLRKITAPQMIKSIMPKHSHIAPKKPKEKMIFINSKQLTEKPTECPIFLGKNKILLTTVKFPPNLKQFEDAKLALGATLKLPKGVQLTCLADGTISYSIDKSVPVNVQAIAEMPAIIAQVRAQMDWISQAVPVNVQPGVAEGEVVDLIDDDDDVNPKSTTEHNKNNEPSSVTEEQTEINRNQNAITNQYSFTDIQEGQVPKSSDNQVSSNENKESLPSAEQPNISDLEHKQLGSTTQNISTEMQQPLVEQVDDHPGPSIEKEIEVNNQAEPPSQDKGAATDVESASESSRNKSKNILSDLMEMSGIFDEDITTAAAPVESVQEQPVLPQESVAKHLPKTVVQPNLDSGPNPAPFIKTALGELSPITSLYELKYACLNKGTFFKLDFSTGYLVPINVCMKQNVKQAAPPVQPLRTVAMKSVIDLTDEDDTLPVSSKAANEHTVDVPTSPSTSSRSLLLPNVLPTATTGPEVKPVKMYKALTPNILRILDKAKMKRKQAQEEQRKKRNELKVDHKLKRKQALTPDDKAKQTPVLETAIISSDDSSDEEPLSNIVKRRKINETELEKVNAEEPEPSNETELEFTEAIDDVDMSNIDLTSKETLIEVDVSQSNDEEEGCILGV